MAEKRYLARIYRPKQQQQTRRFPAGGPLIGCTETSFAMFVDAVTFGGCLVTEDIVRTLSGEEPPNPASPGLNLDQLETVARKLHVEFTNVTGQGWADVERYLGASENRRIVAQLWYADIGGGAIGHAFHLQALRVRNGRRQVLANDPMKKAAAWYDADRVRRAMTTFADRTGVPGDGLRFGLGKRLALVAAGA